MALISELCATRFAPNTMRWYWSWRMNGPARIDYQLTANLRAERESDLSVFEKGRVAFLQHADCAGIGRRACVRVIRRSVSIRPAYLRSSARSLTRQCHRLRVVD